MSSDVYQILDFYLNYPDISQISSDVVQLSSYEFESTQDIYQRSWDVFQTTSHAY